MITQDQISSRGVTVWEGKRYYVAHHAARYYVLDDDDTVLGLGANKAAAIDIAERLEVAAANLSGMMTTLTWDADLDEWYLDDPDAAPGDDMGINIGLSLDPATMTVYAKGQDCGRVWQLAAHTPDDNPPPNLWQYRATLMDLDDNPKEWAARNDRRIDIESGGAA
jgi:hypothetical protein